MAVYLEKRDSRLTGVAIAEVTFGKIRHRRRFADAASAKLWHDVSKAQGKPAELLGVGRGEQQTWGNAARAARLQRAGWKGSRDLSLDQRLATLTELIGEGTPLAKLHKAKLYEVVANLEQRRGRDGGPLSDKTINRYLAVLSAVLGHAGHTIRDERGGEVPLPWRDEPEGRIHFLNRDQEDLVCARLTADDALCVRVIVACALRPGEFFGLEADQVETRWIRLWETKTDTPRSIPIASELSRPLRRMIEDGRLPNPDGFYRRLKAAVRALGLPDEICVYSLRHSGGTALAQDGVSGPLMQRWMGHRKYATTAKYVHLHDEDLERVHLERRQKREDIRTTRRLG